MVYQPIFTEPRRQSEPSRTLSDADFACPIEDRYFEDYTQGAVYEYGYYEVEEAEVVDFARRFDPQSFHIDPDAAANSQFGGLIASGWHVGGMMMRLFADHYLTKVASLASPGLDELRWSAPVRPGDRLKLRTTIVETRLSQSKPDRGLVRTKAELINQEGAVPAMFVAVNFVARRPV
ncbi:MaoC family dehydratase [Dactylosporangium sp. CA-092794]|uniref:MaoC family dehydratase n=1 Tax=Dactylosporangium sp. CA-092794 TaxID=3239929 RepID=UPI003D8CEE8C